MKIAQILNQHRRDFTALYECEHCGHQKRDSGYDDNHFHRSVVPAMQCDKCGLRAADDYRPLAPKYAASDVV